VTLDGGRGAGGGRDAVADGRGVALLLHVRPGLHRLRASARAGAAEGDVWVGAGATTRVALRIAAAASPETPAAVVASGSADRGTRFDDEALRALPRPADPWSLLRDVPGVVLDRVD